MGEERSGNWWYLAPRISVRSCAHLRRFGAWRWSIELQVGVAQGAEALTPRQARMLARRLERLAVECERVNPPRIGRPSVARGDRPEGSGSPTP